MILSDLFAELARSLRSRASEIFSCFSAKISHSVFHSHPTCLSSRRRFVPIFSAKDFISIKSLDKASFPAWFASLSHSRIGSIQLFPRLPTPIQFLLRLDKFLPLTFLFTLFHNNGIGGQAFRQNQTFLN
ncbi:hypothetical protein COU01_00320 [Candidatus Falkowbacteria bacterium CG10_big_fil_rev_8_21_14_0_10_44_15]|uniref:Uncharacterized protein n=1 Tax=Candidatus Falkowbacteria bacterium CG10_big_fil_rev_8_21_14_0_10_44_15 TaxID=1974569 RepID=A0A2H0V0U3_9BACT|nr:MAG: hypothetical protein COU01_00320 [Candidatus Falkowbacteria bacterium CG10_big_fil_rev_8_21_14_0_10_44_15]